MKVHSFTSIRSISDLRPRSQAADWLKAAIALQSQFDQALGASEGDYLNAISEQLIVQERAYPDSAVPSANGVAISSLIRLFLLTENLEPISQTETALNAFGSVRHKAPRAFPSLLKALDWFAYPTLIRTRVELSIAKRVDSLDAAFEPMGCC